jgi:transposase
MSHQRGLDRSQSLLFLERLEDHIGPDNPVRFLDAFVASLDLHGLRFAKAQSTDTGRPPYAPSDLLKLYLYGYLTLTFQFERTIEQTCSTRLITLISI